MSKTTKVVLIVTSVFLACAIGAGIVIGVFLNNGGKFDNFYDIFGGKKIEVDESEELDLGGVAAISVSCTSAEIQVLPSDDARVTLKGTVVSPRVQEKYLDVYTEGDTLYIKVKLEAPFFSFYNGFDMTVYLPGYDVYDIDVHCSSGDIDITGMEFGGLVLSRSSGDIKLDNCEADRLSCESSSGDTLIESCEFGSVDINSTSGDIDISGTPGDVRIRSTSGNTNISEADGALDIGSTSGGVTIGMADNQIDSVTVEATSGNIRLYLFPDTAFDLSARVTSGNIKTDLDIRISGSLSEKFDEDNISGESNGGGAPVDLKTTSGNISILAK